MRFTASLCKLFVLLGVSLSLIGIASETVFGQLNYSGFSSTNVSEFSLLGDTGLNGTSLRLIRATSSVPRTAAAAWHYQTHDISDGFVTMFTFRIVNGGGLNGGGDGFAFVLHSSGINAIGAGGGSMGYGTNEGSSTPTGIINSLAFEFDTYLNDTLGDPNNNHFSLHANPSGPNNANESFAIGGAVTTIPPLRDGAAHLVRIEYDGPLNGHQLRVYIGNMAAPIYAQAVDIGSIINGTDANVGFTAGAATAFENHDIMNWSFVPLNESPTYQGIADDANAVGPLAVSSFDYHPGADPVTHHVAAPRLDTSVLPSAATEIWAKYYYPTDLSGGPYPLVLMLAGNHGTCGTPLTTTSGTIRNDTRIDYTSLGRCVDVPPATYSVAPVHRGYDYLAERLASWGYIVASINPNLGINQGVGYEKSTNPDFPEYTDDDNLILARGRLVLRHLQKLSEWNKGYRPFAQVDTFGTKRKNLNAYLGMKITVGDQPVSVHRIGRMYLNGNRRNHELKIVRATDNVTMASVSVSMTNWNHQQFKYATVSPVVTLAANTSYYVVSEEKRNQDEWYDSNSAVTAGDGITIDTAIQSSNGTTDWTNPSGSLQSFGPVDLIYEVGSSSTPIPGVNFKGKIDFSNVGLMGHSRGGEGMRAAYDLYNEAENPWKQRIFDSMALDTGIKGIFEIAPTDGLVQNASGTTIRELNAMKTAWSVLLPACDGDVFNLRGVKPFDRMLKLTSETPARAKSSLFVFGTNHNAFNSQWHLSDSSGTNLTFPSGEGCTGAGNTAIYRTPVVNGGHVNTPPQMAIGSSAFLGFMRGNVGAAAVTTLNRLFDPSFDIPSSIRAITSFSRGFVRSSDTSQTKQFNTLSFTPTTNLCASSSITMTCSDNDPTRMEAFRSTIQPRGDAHPEIIHDEGFVATNVKWHSASPARYVQVNWSGASSSLTTYATLDFRVSRHRDPSNRFAVSPLNSSPTTNFSIQVVMADGRISKAVPLSKYTELRGPVGSVDNPWRPQIPLRDLGQLHPVLQTVRIPLGDFEGADLTQISAVRFIFNDTRTGSIFLSNILVSN